MAEQRKYRKFTAQQKLEIVLAGLRGERNVKDVCREHEIAETLYYSWRDKLLEGGRLAWPAKTGVRATAIPSPRPSSSPGSPSSRSASSGARSSRPSMTPGRRSPPTSSPATTGPTRGWATAPRRR